MLKSLEFSSSLGDDGSPVAAADDRVKTLETLLLEKNRTLQTENTQLKVSNNDMTSMLGFGIKMYCSVSFKIACVCRFVLTDFVIIFVL